MRLGRVQEAALVAVSKVLFTPVVAGGWQNRYGEDRGIAIRYTSRCLSVRIIAVAESIRLLVGGFLGNKLFSGNIPSS